MGEDHHEDPGLTELSGGGVLELADVAEVDLGLLPWRRVHRDVDVFGLRRPCLLESPIETLHRRQAPLEVVEPLDQQPVDGRRAQALGHLLDDEVLPGLNAGHLLLRRRGLGSNRFTKSGQLWQLVRRALQKASKPDGSSVLALRLSVDVENLGAPRGARAHPVQPDELLQSMHVLKSLSHTTLRWRALAGDFARAGSGDFGRPHLGDFARAGLGDLG